VRWYDEESNVVEATLTEARANHYYPSVTSILDVINKPEVETWKQNIIIDEAMKLNPIFAEHEIDEFKETVRFRAGIKFSEAAQLGTLWHTLLINHFLNIDDAPDIPTETIHALDEKLKDLEIHLEQHDIPFVNKEDGYAGTIDAIGYRMADDVKIPIVLDWKTQATNGKSARYYDSWPMQLAAYANAAQLGFNTEIWNAVLSTTDPGKVWFKRWKDQPCWWEAFDSAHILWCTLNNYNPRTGVKWFKDE
jgi:hypothetical protein